MLRGLQCADDLRCFRKPRVDEQHGNGRLLPYEDGRELRDGHETKSLYRWSENSPLCTIALAAFAPSTSTLGRDGVL